MSAASEVRIWGQRAGALAPDPRLGCCVFECAPAWGRAAIELAPRAMPIANGRAPFAFPSLPTATYQGLPGMVADALPDSFGNALIDAWMQSKGIEKRAITVLDRLAHMGKRALGALEFHPATGFRKDSATVLEISSLVEAGLPSTRRDQLAQDFCIL